MKKIIISIFLFGIIIAYSAYIFINSKQTTVMIRKKEHRPVTETTKDHGTLSWSDELNIFSHDFVKPLHVIKAKPPSNNTLAIKIIPYKYIGKMTYDNAQYIFLEYQEQTIVVKEGYILPGNYRYDYLENNKLFFTDMRDRSKHEITIGAEM